MNYYSLIIWDKEIIKAPTDENLLVLVKDDTGDTDYYYITVAWRYNSNGSWISDNEILCGEVIAWAKMPDPKELKELKLNK